MSAEIDRQKSSSQINGQNLNNGPSTTKQLDNFEIDDDVVYVSDDDDDDEEDEIDDDEQQETESESESEGEDEQSPKRKSSRSICKVVLSSFSLFVQNRFQPQNRIFLRRANRTASLLFNKREKVELTSEFSVRRLRLRAKVMENFQLI